MAIKKPHQRPKSAIDRHLGRRLSRRRIEMGLTAIDLDRALSTRIGTVARFENGERAMDAVQLFALSRALKVSVLYFFEKSPALPLGRSRDVPGPEEVAEAERFLEAFLKIDDFKIRRDILGLLKAAADDKEAKPA